MENFARGRAAFFFQSQEEEKDPSRYLPPSTGGARTPVCFVPNKAQVYRLCAALASDPCFLLFAVGRTFALVSLASGIGGGVRAQIGGDVFQIARTAFPAFRPLYCPHHQPGFG